jgi:hypothetical protein
MVSQGNFDHLALTNITTNVSSAPSQRCREALSTTSSTHPSDYMSDLITPALSPIAQSTISFIHEYPERVATMPMPVRKPGNIFSTFRTHINLPTPLFTRTPKSTQPASRSPSVTYNLPNIPVNQLNIDLEAQHSSLVAPTTVSTQIWSGTSLSTQTPHPGTTSTSHIPINTHTHSKNASQDLELELDPMAPKMGTRAYRERERREFEAEKKEMTRVLADNVRVEIGIELLGDDVEENGGENKGKGKEGVVVKKTLERREEEA